MIEKIIKIQNIAKFRNYACSGDTSFGKLTLIYGENGKGKSSLAAIFRSLCMNDNSITSKCSIGSDKQINIQIKLSEGFVEYKDNSWTLPVPNIVVFDSTYVNANVFSGDRVDAEHKKNLYHIVIGEKSVDLSKILNNIDIEIRQLNKDLKDIEENIKNHILGDMGFYEFLGLDPQESLEEKISEIERNIIALEESEKIKTADFMNIITLPEIDFQTISNWLMKTIDAFDSDIENRFREHCGSLGDQVEPWLRCGMVLVEKNPTECPFCGSEINLSSLYSIYKAYFSDSYRILKSELQCILGDYLDKLSSSALLGIQKSLSENKEKESFWRKYIVFELLPINFSRVEEIWNMVSSELIRLLSEKINTPLEIQDTNVLDVELQKDWNHLISMISDYNKQIININELIKNEKNNISILDLDLQKKKLNLQNNVKKRHEDCVNDLCAVYNKISKKIEVRKNDKTEKQNQLRVLNESLFNKYQKGINETLLRYGADFQIVEVKGTNPAGRPSISYSLSINGELIPLGSETTTDKPCFKTTLSDGEKNALAFAFFIAYVNQLDNLDQKIIIIDDPITSQDQNRRDCTKQEIKNLSKLAKQTIVLSHDPFFLKGIGEYNNPRTLSIIRSGKDSAICNWDIEEETKSQYERDYSKLLSYKKEGWCNILSVKY